MIEDPITVSEAEYREFSHKATAYDNLVRELSYRLDTRNQSDDFLPYGKAIAKARVREVLDYYSL